MTRRPVRIARYTGESQRAVEAAYRADALAQMEQGYQPTAGEWDGNDLVVQYQVRARPPSVRTVALSVLLAGAFIFACLSMAYILALHWPVPFPVRELEYGAGNVIEPGSPLMAFGLLAMVLIAVASMRGLSRLWLTGSPADQERQVNLAWTLGALAVVPSIVYIVLGWGPYPR